MVKKKIVQKIALFVFINISAFTNPLGKKLKLTGKKEKAGLKIKLKLHQQGAEEENVLYFIVDCFAWQ